MIRKAIVLIACASIPVLLSAEPRGSVTPHWTLPTEPAVGWDSGDYVYDHGGNIVKIGRDTFAYDGVNRLTASTVTAYGVSTSQKFEYDRYGNLTVADGTASNGAACRETLTVQTLTNHLTQTCECGVCQTWTYDDAGNQTALGTSLSYRWDAAGAMTELKGPVAHERYVYDANDERVLMISLDSNQEVTRRWTWRDASNKVAREAVEHVGSDVWTESRDYVYRNGTLLASFESPNAPVAERHYHVDHLGTPRLITDNTRRKLAVETYMPFGGRALGSDATYIGFQDRMRFTGHERDGEGSAYRPTLDYMHARYYTPDWGRFLSPDRVVGNLSEPGSWNRYAYALNDPMNRIDPSGLQALPIRIIQGGAGTFICYGTSSCEAVVEVSARDPLHDLLVWQEWRWLTKPSQLAAGVPRIPVRPDRPLREQRQCIQAANEKLMKGMQGKGAWNRFNDARPSAPKTVFTWGGLGLRTWTWSAEGLAWSYGINLVWNGTPQAVDYAGQLRDANVQYEADIAACK